MTKSFSLLVSALFGAVCFSIAQPILKPASLVEDTKRSGITFSDVKLFTVENNTAIRSAQYPEVDRMLEEGVLLELDMAMLGRLQREAPRAFTLSLATPSRSNIEVELVEVNPFAPDFRVVTDRNPNGISVELGRHYRGVVKGSEGSIAAFSFFRDEVVGMVSLPRGGNYVLGRLDGSAAQREANHHILYRDDRMKVDFDFSCATPDDGYVYSREELTYSPDGSRALTDCVGLYFETEVDIFNSEGSSQNVTNFITGMYNQVATIYANESINTVMSELFIWTTTDPYTGTNTSTLLSQFQNNRTTINGDLGQLLTYRSIGGGQAAGFDGICNPSTAQSLSVSGIVNTYNNFPTYSWTVMVVTHEFGHTFGSRHTHACVWNGNGTAIDGCSGQTEGSCPLPGIPPEGGTIMSYCHQQSVGINFSLGFGPQPGDVIRNEVANGSCLQPCANPNAPAAPTNLVATTQSSSSISLSWTDNANNEDGFVVERSSGGSAFSQVASLGANVTSYTDNGLSAATTYSYRVYAFNVDGNSVVSNTASATTNTPGGGGGPCAGCVDFSVTSTSSFSNQDAAANVTVLDNGATLLLTDNTWRRLNDSYNVTPNTILEFEFMSTAQGEIHGVGLDADNVHATNELFQVYGTQNWAIRDFTYTTPGSFQTFSIPAGTYMTGTLSLTFVNDNDAGSGNNSFFRNVRLYESGGPTPPAAPSGLSATANSSSQISLSWTDNSTDEDNFLIERSTGGGAFSQVATVGANVTSYTDNGLTASTTYTYRVAASNVAGNSAYSNTASATTQAGGGGPCAGCIDFNTTTTISYSNQDVAQNVTVLDNGATLLMQDNTWRRTTATFNVTPNTVIEFEFQSTAQGEIHGIGFDNDDNLSSGLIFQVYGVQNWGIRDFDYTSVGSYQSFSIPVGTYYTGNNLYLVLVNDYDAGSGNNSYFKNVKIYEAAGPTPPAAPSSLTANATSSSSISLSWTDNATDEDNFIIERATGGGAFSQIATVGANITSYTDNGLAASTTYNYRVAASNAGGTSAYSNTASATTQAGGGGCTVVTVDNNDFEAGWGIWNDGGSDARRSINDAAFAFSGNYCIRLRDNNVTSTMTTDNLDLSLFEDITVDFTYITNSMDNANEDFWLQISTNGGASYTTVAEWNLFDEFVNNVREFDVVTITAASVGGFSANTRLRFRCDASSNGDQVYIDDVLITGCTTGNLPATGLGNAGTQAVSADLDLNDLIAYPNPTSGMLQLKQLPAGAELRLFNAKGQLVYEATDRKQIDMSRLVKGMYVLYVRAGEAVKTIKVIKE
ncbi:MAG: T9SS C-terminal target domain-containing protein [Bacteroidetes bacterium]|nr:MAG: T9SS C-terminal target domain-containing protein [Bacteroidota bacterium]